MIMTERLWIFAGLIAAVPRLPMVDLGAGHCKFSALAHLAGFDVTSVDVRTERVPEGIEWPFLHQDVRVVDLSPYGIILMLGLLYHLTLRDQIHLLEKCRGKIVVADTFYADADRSTIICPAEPYEGVLFDEVEADPTASFGNPQSFWHTEGSLYRLFARYGFTVLKVLPEHTPNRSFYVLRP